jgi:hypothetical protein
MQHFVPLPLLERGELNTRGAVVQLRLPVVSDQGCCFRKPAPALRAEDPALREVHDELAADEALQAGAAQECVQLLLERPVQGSNRVHERSPADRLVRSGRETPASQGRRERS